MDLEEIKQIIGLMKRNELSEFELEREGFKIRIKRGFNGSATQVETIPLTVAPPTVTAPPVAVQMPPPAGGKAALPADIAEIKSPMVGTFYRAPSPDASPFVEVGTEVNEDTVVCIIEAMKVMNEIKAEVRGVVTDVMMENAKAVEFGQPLFRVRKA